MTTNKRIGYGFIAALFAFLISAMFWSHKNPPGPPPNDGFRDTYANREFRGTHLLRQVRTIAGTDATLHGASFFLFGGISGSATTEIKVSFAWQGNDNVYRFMTLPLDSVRVKPDPNVGTPYVKFRWSGGGATDASAIYYAVIFVNPKDWPEDIQMPIGGRGPQ